MKRTLTLGMMIALAALLLGFVLPARSAPSPLATDAISALTDLDSAVSSGVNFRDYSNRLADTNIVVQSPNNPRL